MGRERVAMSSTSTSTNSSSIAEDCSSSSLSQDDSRSSSSSSAFSSDTGGTGSSTSSISRDNKSTGSKRCRRKSLSSNARTRTDREPCRKNSCKENAYYDRSKKRRKSSCKRSSHGKYDKKKRKKDSKKRKLDMDSKDISSGKEIKRGRTSEAQIDSKANERSNNLLEVAMNAQEQQKALIRHNAEIAKARLESGELQKAREEQRKMHQLYGTVDWRANRKLRTEKKMLERTVAAGKSLASLEQREYARMDAFRVALGLPTAEAQRQAEWRREQTQALADLDGCFKPAASPSNNKCKKAKQGLIGPMRPP